jgi:apolipoprotein N-acyltransferase
MSFINIMRASRSYFISLLLGALGVLAFAPFAQRWLIFISFAWLLFAWSRATPRQVLLHGWLFSLGLQSAGVSWIYYSLHYHGGTPSAFAALMIVLLAMYLSIYPALAGYVGARFCKTSATIKLVVLWPLTWGLAEWLQGWVMTGFAWMQPGYTQIDLPLSGFAPLLGAHGVGVLVVMSAAVLVLLISQAGYRQRRVWTHAVAPLVLCWVLGALLQQVSWTTPTAEPVRVALVQGNFAQSLKWQRDMHNITLRRYRELTLQHRDADLVLWPETAIPDYQHRVPQYLQQLQEDMRATNTDLLLGIFIKNTDTGYYNNALLNIDGSSYRKRHLVPLGEFIPLRFLISIFNRWVDIPMSDIEAGATEQALLQAAGQPLGVTICFEDAFSRDLRRDLPQATLLLNISNDAWFEDSHESYQHHEIARMRALETGRYMVRATNTGISSVIDDKGRVVAASPHFKVDVLRAEAQPMTGATPYVWWGDALLLLVSIATLAWAVLRVKAVIKRESADERR